MNRLILIAAALAALVSCQLPLSGPQTPEGMGQFSIKASMPKLKPVNLQANQGRTILPTAPAYYYTIDLVGGSSYSFTDLVSLDESFTVPLGAYTLTVTMRSATAPNPVIGVSDAQAITVSATAAANQYFVQVLPQTGGTGYLSVSYSWPAEKVSIAEIELVDITDTENPVVISPTYDLGAGTATLSQTVPSGNYLVKLMLSDPKGGNTNAHPTVSEIAQIYNNLETSKTYALSYADLNGPPVDVTDFQAVYNLGNDSFELSWTSGPSTREAFNIYQNNALVGQFSRADVSTTLFSTPTSANETFKITAVNAFGESVGVEAIAAVPSVNPQPTNLKVGRSTTTGSKNTTLEISWDAGSAVTIYRAENLAGPYQVAHTAGPSDSTFTDSDANGLLTGTTYYYTISTTGGYLYNLTSTNYQANFPATTVSHLNPVAEVVSGTTLAWNGTQAVPVIGVPYRVPSTTQIPAPLIAAPAAIWDSTERPLEAILAGGYSYSIWGHNNFNPYPGELLIAAFDSQGVYQNSIDLQTNSYISAWSVLGTNISITGQAGTITLPWSSLDWFSPTFMQVSIDFTVPTSPVINFLGAPGGLVSLDTALNPAADVLNVDAELDNHPGYSLIEWTIDGNPSHPALTIVNAAQGQISINSQYLSLGSHEVTIVIYDGTNFYSATFTLQAVFSANGQS